MAPGLTSLMDPSGVGQLRSDVLSGRNLDAFFLDAASLWLQMTVALEVAKTPNRMRWAGLQSDDRRVTSMIKPGTLTIATRARTSGSIGELRISGEGRSSRTGVPSRICKRQA